VAVAVLARLFRRQPTPIETTPPAPRFGTPLDRLVTLPDAELDMPRALEGACSYFSGVPLEANPWPRDAAPALWQGWRHGWLYAAVHADYYGAMDESRWLVEEQAFE
jgi:hypothetical protein